MTDALLNRDIVLMTGMLPSQVCRKYEWKDCGRCDDRTCSENLSPSDVAQAARDLEKAHPKEEEQHTLSIPAPGGAPVMKIGAAEKHSYLLVMGNAENEEIVRIAYNGDIFVHGKLVENDLEVAEGFRAWLIDAGYMVPKTTWRVSSGAMKVSEVCRTHHFQDCSHCDDHECLDYTAAMLEPPLKAALLTQTGTQAALLAKLEASCPRLRFAARTLRGLRCRPPETLWERIVQVFTGPQYEPIQGEVEVAVMAPQGHAFGHERKALVFAAEEAAPVGVLVAFVDYERGSW